MTDRSRSGAMRDRSGAWVLRWRPRPSAKLRLFCFPYGGAGASAYRGFQDAFGADVEVVGIQLPGRENRLSEPPLTRLSVIVDGIASALGPLCDRPFAFFGHSLGALVSFELTRRLRALGRPSPSHLFVSARRAPQLIVTREAPLHTLPDDELMQVLRHYNGTPAGVLQNADLMELLLPALRADFTAHETYEYEPEPPLDVPITAFGGDNDASIPLDGLSAWSAQTTRAFSMQLFPGDHFYLVGALEPLSQAITMALAATLSEKGMS